MNIRSIFPLLLLAGWLTAASLYAQETKPADPPAKKNEPAAEEKQPEKKAEPAAEKKEPAAEKKEPAKQEPAAEKKEPSAEVKAEAAKFGELFDKWKNLLGDMRALQVKYQSAKTSEEKKTLEAEFNKLIEQGEAMRPQVAAGAEAAYQVDPLKNRDAERFLVSQTQSAFNRDAYEESARLGILLAENEYKKPDVYRIAGLSSLYIGDYELARKYLKMAEEAKALDSESVQLLANLDETIANARKEDELRAKEASANNLPRVLLATNKGDIEIELFENEAPNTVASFVSLVDKGFYDGLVFHRVLPGFMAQGGDPQGLGIGGPGYNIPCECYEPNHRLHYRGSLSMAHSGKDTGGSQFFLTMRPTSHLDGRHTVFGRIVKGMEVLSQLQRIDPDNPRGGVKPDKIVKATILRKRDHEYKFRKVGDPDPNATPEKKPDDKRKPDDSKKEDNKKPDGDKPDDKKKPDESKKEDNKKPDDAKKPEENKKTDTDAESKKDEKNDSKKDE